MKLAYDAMINGVGTSTRDVLESIQKSYDDGISDEFLKPIICLKDNSLPVAKIEKEHEERYRKLLDNLKEDVVFKCDEETVWVCRNCGYIYIGKEAPKVCPACKHPQAYFERRAENY